MLCSGCTACISMALGQDGSTGRRAQRPCALGVGDKRRGTAARQAATAWGGQGRADRGRRRERDATRGQGGGGRQAVEGPGRGSWRRNGEAKKKAMHRPDTERLRRRGQQGGATRRGEQVGVGVGVSVSVSVFVREREGRQEGSGFTRCRWAMGPGKNPGKTSVHTDPCICDPG